MNGAHYCTSLLHRCYIILIVIFTDFYALGLAGRHVYTAAHGLNDWKSDFLNKSLSIEGHGAKGFFPQFLLYETRKGNKADIWRKGRKQADLHIIFSHANVLRMSLCSLSGSFTDKAQGHSGNMTLGCKILVSEAARSPFLHPLPVCQEKKP